jgi:hypothetical protein
LGYRPHGLCGWEGRPGILATSRLGFD